MGYIILYGTYVSHTHIRLIKNRTLPFAKKEPTFVRSLVWANVGDNRDRGVAQRHISFCYCHSSLPYLNALHNMIYCYPARACASKRLCDRGWCPFIIMYVYVYIYICDPQTSRVIAKLRKNVNVRSSA